MSDALLSRANNLLQDNNDEATSTPKQNDELLSRADDLLKDENEVKDTDLLPTITEGLINGAGFGATPYIAQGTGLLGSLAGIKNLGQTVGNVEFDASRIGDLDAAVKQGEQDYQFQVDRSSRQAEANPVTHFTSNLVGGISTATAAPNRLLAPINVVGDKAHWLKKLIQASANGAVGGTTLGFLQPTSTPGVNVEERLDNAETGLKWGAGLGAGAQAIGSGYQAVKNGDFKGNFPKIARAYDIGYNENRFFFTKKFEDETIARMNKSINQFVDNINTIGEAEAGVRSKDIAILKDKLSDHSQALQKVDDELAAQIKEIKSGEYTENTLEFNKLYKQAVDTAIERKNAILKQISDLTKSNKRIFGDFTKEFNNYNKIQEQAYKSDTDLMAKDINDQQPDALKNKFHDIIKKVGTRLGGSYDKLEARFDSLVPSLKHDKHLNTMIDEYVSTHGAMPDKKMYNLMDKLAQKRAMDEIKAGDTEFKFDINGPDGSNPLNTLLEKVNKIASLGGDPDAPAIIQNAIAKYINNGEISLNDFRTLLNSSSTRGTSSELSTLMENLRSTSGGHNYAKALQEFNNDMRKARGAYLDRLPTDDAKALAKEFNELNETYAEFMGYRDTYNKVNPMSKNLSKEQLEQIALANSKVNSAIKSFGTKDTGEGAQFYDFIKVSKIPEIKEFAKDLVGYQKAAQKLAARPDYKDTVLANDMTQGVDDLKVLHDSKPEDISPEQVNDLLLYNKGDRQLVNKDGVSQVNSNLTDITNLETNPVGETIPGIENHMNDLKTLKDGQSPEFIPGLNEDLKNLLTTNLNTKKNIDLGNTTSQQTAKVAAETRKASLEGAFTGKHGIKVENGEIITPQQQLKELENPTSKNILDDMIRVRGDKNKLSNRIQSIIEKGADPESKAFQGSAVDQLEQLLSEIKTRGTEAGKMIPGTSPIDVDKLSTLASDVELIGKQSLRGTLNPRSLGLVESSSHHVANIAGKGVRTLDDIGKITRIKPLLKLLKDPASIMLEGAKPSAVATAATRARLQQVLDNYAAQMGGITPEQYSNLDTVEKTALKNTLLQSSSEAREAQEELDNESEEDGE